MNIPRPAALAFVVGALSLHLAAPAGAQLVADFNGDGRDDLAVGVRGESSSITSFGAVNVIYGSAAGLTEVDDEFWHQDVDGIIDNREQYDYFGQAVAAGDFNGDGRSDLAIGVPQEGVGAYGQVGAVHVLYGTASGLTATGSEAWTQNSSDVPEVVEGGERFGSALAAADFNNDGRDDLAIGAPGEYVGSVRGTGVVHVLYGVSGGLTGTGSQLWHQDVEGIAGVREFGDQFGAALATGDFLGSAVDDLAIGAHGEAIGAAEGAGAVHVLPGGSGLSTNGSVLYHRDSAGVPGVVNEGDVFGAELAMGDFNGNGRDDLAIGASGTDFLQGGGGVIEDAGNVTILYGSAGSAGTGASNESVNQSWSSSTGGNEAHDAFGSELSVADFEADGYDDLAVGVFGEDLGSATDAGAVNVFYGTALSGLTLSEAQLWHQNAGLPEVAEISDNFGFALAARDFDGDGRGDLAVGAPGECVTATTCHAGMVQVLYGSSARLLAAGSQLWHQDTPGIKDIAEYADKFGRDLTH